MVKEMAQQKLREIKEFEGKVVVDSKHFAVNTRVQQSHQMQKKNSMLQEPAVKIGLRLGHKRLREMTGRQVLASKELTNPPVSSFSLGKFVNNERHSSPIKVKMDLTKTPFDRKKGANEMSDFTRYTRRDVSNSAATSKKVKMVPLTETEKSGPKYGSIERV